MKPILASVVLMFVTARAALCAEPRLDSAASVRAVEQLREWLQMPREMRAPFSNEASQTWLTKTDAAKVASLLWEDHAALIRDTRKDEMAARKIELDGLQMRFETVSFAGKDGAPAGGRSLFISMHGGGGGPAELNDSQWRNQVALAKAYRPAEGIYVAPRAPTNTWDLWHQPHIDRFFARLIENLVVLEGVNPDRVYILGYSAGGDGVYQLASRMADRLAAASMMAGHPNSASPLGLRNIGFAIQAGELDAAYHRNTVAAEWGRKLDALEKADPGGYAHFTEVHKGKGHWMDLEDRKAIPWMERFTRNPLPEKIVWHQDPVKHTHFYWLAVAPEAAHEGLDITATRKGQTITLQSGNAGDVTVLLNDVMLNLDEAVTVTSGGKVIFNAQAGRKIEGIRRTIAERGDPRLVFSAEIRVSGVK